MILTLLTVLTICSSAFGQAFSIFDPAMQGPQAASAPSSPTPDILWWKFEPGSGTTVNGNVGQNGILLSESQWLGGYSGSGYAITNNSTSYGLASSSAVAYGVNKITVTFWLYYKPLTGTRMLIESSSNFNTPPYTFASYLDTALNVSMHSSGATAYLSKQFSAPSADTWHHVAFVFDASVSGGRIVYYLNGVEQTATGTPNNALGGAAFTISAQTLYVTSRAGSSLRMAGAIDDLRIYSRELTSTEVASVIATPQ